jgi:hypothetical protein
MNGTFFKNRSRGTDVIWLANKQKVTWNSNFIRTIFKTRKPNRTNVNFKNDLSFSNNKQTIKIHSPHFKLWYHVKTLKGFIYNYSTNLCLLNQSWNDIVFIWMRLFLKTANEKLINCHKPRLHDALILWRCRSISWCMPLFYEHGGQTKSFFSFELKKNANNAICFF